VSGGASQQINKPEYDPATGTYKVSYNQSVNAGVDAGSKGDNGSVGGNVGGSQTNFGSQKVKTQEEAQALYDKSQGPNQEEPETAEDAAKMPAGTTVGTTTSGTVGANGSVNAGPVSVNGGASTTSSSTVAVTSKGDGVVQVNTSQSDKDSV